MTDSLKRKIITNHNLVALISGSFALLFFTLAILEAFFHIDIVPRWMMHTAPIWLFTWYTSIAVTIFAISYPFLTKIPKNIYSWIALIFGSFAFIWVVSYMIKSSIFDSYDTPIVMLTTPFTIFSGAYGFFGKVTNGARARCIFGLLSAILFLLLTVPGIIYSMMTE